MATKEITIQQLASMLAERAPQVAAYLLPNGKREMSEWVCGGIDGNPGRSLKVRIKGNKAGVWSDFAEKIGGDLVDLWYLVMRCTKGEALKQIRDYLNINEFTEVPPPAKVAAKEVRFPDPVRPIHKGYHAEIKARLMASKPAIAYLQGIKRGLTMSTIKHFELGLSKPFKLKDSDIVVSDAIVAPMRAVDGSFVNRSAFITVPGVTQNPFDDAGWMKGSPTVYYSDAIKQQTSIFICEGLKDVWRHWQAINEAGLTDRILLVSSTHGGAIPLEWEDPAYWKRWKNIYLGQDNDAAGNATADRVLSRIGREARRISVPYNYGKDWTDFWQNGGSMATFLGLCKKAEPIIYHEK